MAQKFSMYVMGRFSLGMAAALLLPLFYTVLHRQEGGGIWALLLLLYLGLGFGMLAEGQRYRHQVDARHGAHIMWLLWLLMSVMGMLPYFCLGWLDPVDALFESVSTVTTVGITLLPEDAPEALWLWRAELAWLGGMNFLMMLVTVLPQVSGCFGLTLAFRRGMMFSSMLGQMSGRGRQIIGVYAAVTALSWIMYILAGVSPLHALKAAMLTISTTGGIVQGVFMADGNPWPEIVTVVSLLLAAGNFLRYWRTFQRRDFRDYYSNPEVKFFLGTVVLFGLIVTWHLWRMEVYPFHVCLLHSFFHVLSFASTTGLLAAPAYSWPDPEQYILLLLAFWGGCLGSATGGLKSMRLIVLFKMMRGEVRRTLHPHMVANVVVGGNSVAMVILGRILSFFFLYSATFFLFVVLISLSGIELYEAVGCATACFTTLGTALSAEPAGGFAAISDGTKLVCSFFMVLSRVEIFAFLILLQAGTENRQRRW